MRRLFLPLLILSGLTTLVLFSFGPVLFRNEQFAFRDAGVFYYPLYQRVQAEWQAGRWPLWEPEENGGTPLLGNPTAAVLYPGKLIYAALPYPWAARVYVVAHVLLAFAAMLALLRSWGTSWTGSALAALSYAFAAPILFQYCNIVFLVGAAWLPLGFRAVDRWLRLGRRTALLELALVLAMQTLGGDPEAAYVLGICAGGYALRLARWRPAGFQIPKSRIENRKSKVSLFALAVVTAWVIATLLMALWAPAWRAREPRPRPLPWIGWFHQVVLAGWVLAGVAVVVRRLRWGSRFALGRMLLGLAGAALLAAALTAAQLVPVWEFSSRSLRAQEETHDTFYLSLEPARLLGLLWPNVYGDGFTHSRSWFEILPPLDKHARLWCPSLYLGGLTLVMALGAVRFRGGPPWRAWLSAVAALSLLACLGEYSSPLWWARCLPALARELGPHDAMFPNPIREDSYLRDGDGSFYWLMTVLLPGFRQFRFPSKLLTFSTLALTALAGLGWERLTAVGRASQPDVGLGSPTYGTPARTARLAGVLLALTLAGLVVTIACRDAIVARFVAAGAGELASYFGPWDPWGSYHELRSALAQGTIVLALALALALYGRRRPALAGALALALVTADLALANTRYVLTVPQRLMDAESQVVRIIADAEQKDPAGQPFRVHRMPFWTPARWWKESSTNRLREVVAWSRDSIAPKYGVTSGIPYTLTRSTTQLSDYERFYSGFPLQIDGRAASRFGLRRGDEVFYWPRRGFDLWNTRYFVVPADRNRWKDEDCSFAAFLEQTERIDPPPGAFAGPRQEELRREWIDREDLQILRNLAVYPRAWVVHQARFHRPFAGWESPDTIGPVQDLLFANDLLWHDPSRKVYDPRTLAWVEAGTKKELAGYLPAMRSQASESVTITRYAPQRVELEAVLEQPGLVILADVDYPGWRLTIDGTPAPIYRANFLMRGAAVRAGRHRLVYTYEPKSFTWGRWVSVAGLAVVGLLAAWFWWRPLAPSLGAGR